MKLELRVEHLEKFCKRLYQLYYSRVQRRERQWGVYEAQLKRWAKRFEIILKQDKGSLIRLGWILKQVKRGKRLVALTPNEHLKFKLRLKRYERLGPRPSKKK